MIEIEVSGFQSVEHVKVSVDGFAALVGRSNIGKSALVRAVKFALTNEEGKYFVRHGDACPRKVKKAKTCKCQATVCVRMEGFDLTWERGDAINRYTFNGKEYDKPDRGVPEFLTQFGFGTLKIGGDKSSVQVSDQFDPLFLINESGSVVAETLSDVGRLDRINAAMRAAEKDRKESASTRKVREKDVEALQDRLIPYARLDHDLGCVDSIQTGLTNINKRTRVVEELTRFVLSTSNLAGQIKTLGNLTAIAVPDTQAVLTKRSRFEQVTKFVDQFAQRATQYRALQWVEKMPDISAEAMQMATKKFNQFTAWYDKLVGLKTRFEGLKKIDVVQPAPFDPVKSKFASLLVIERLCTQYQKVDAHVSSFDGVESVLISQLEFPSRVAELLSSISYMEQANRRQRTLAGAVEKLNQDYAKAVNDESAVQAEINTLGVCPTCTQSLHLHHEEHTTSLLRVGT